MRRNIFTCHTMQKMTKSIITAVAARRRPMREKNRGMGFTKINCNPSG